MGLSYLKLGVALLLLGAGATAVLSYRHLATEVATADARIATAERLAADQARELDILSKEMVRRAEFDRALRETRQQINGRLDQVTHEDPVARDYLGERIPDGVRNAVLPPPVR